MKKNLLLFFVLCLFCLNSCYSVKSDKNHIFLPDVINPTFQTYNTDGERGFLVEFAISGNQAKPIAVIFNHIKKSLNPQVENSKHYKENLILQTHLIENYHVESSELPDGILFEYEGNEYLKEVKFRKIK